MFLRINMSNRNKENQRDIDEDGTECNKDELSEFIVSVIKTNNLHDECIQNEENDDHELPNLSGDRANIMMLTFLYFMQGVVSGLSAAMPILLQNYGATYNKRILVWQYGPLV